jgi:hypothetical protein
VQVEARIVAQILDVVAGILRGGGVAAEGAHHFREAEAIGDMREIHGDLAGKGRMRLPAPGRAQFVHRYSEDMRNDGLRNARFACTSGLVFRIVPAPLSHGHAASPCHGRPRLLRLEEYDDDIILPVPKWLRECYNCALGTPLETAPTAYR